MTKRRTVQDIIRLKGVRPIVSLTAYTAPMARIIDNHADFILVGDSLGMVLYDFESTLPVSVDMMINHGAAVVRATNQAMVIVDMPFGSYQGSREAAFDNAARIMKETGCTAVKLEGGIEMAETAAFLTERGVPVLAHVGLVPQSVHALGGYRVMGKEQAEGERIKSDAVAMQEAGAFGIVLECMAAGLAALITQELAIPTIGIGASAVCDGQILVSEDMLGLTGGHVPKFVKQYSILSDDIDKAVASYAADVKKRKFPGPDQIYSTGKVYNLKSAAE